MSTIIEAIANGLIDGGAKTAYGFPGFSSEKILEQISSNYTISTNERTAYGEAYGSSIAGARAVVAFKNIGLNIASDAYLHSVISGVNAGLVVCITDDIEVWGSQECQDSRPLIDYYGGLLFEPDSLQVAYDFSQGAFELSESLDIPIVIRVTNQTIKLKGSYDRDVGQSKKTSILRNVIKPEKFVVHPYYHQQQSKNLIAKKKAIQNYVEKDLITDYAKNHRDGVVRFGLGNDVSHSYENVDVLQINTVPAPQAIINDFIRDHSKVAVSESGDAWLYDQTTRVTASKRQLISQCKSPKHSIEFTKWTRYQDLFKVINSIKENIVVVGDITQFTVESEDTVDVALSMGASIPVAVGVAQIKGFSIALVGDCSFNHEGLQIVYEAMNRGVNLCIVIIDNGVSWCTGAQANAVPVSQIDFPDKVHYKRFDYHTELLSKFKSELLRCKNYRGVSIIHVTVPVGSLDR
jgi:indolepyruvate ferredoxin oxidoreductase alpha subunit